MATTILLQLQETLSKPDFETIEAFITFFNQFKPEEAGQTRIGFEYFLQNLEKRYQKNFRHCHEVLSITPESGAPDEAEHALIANEPESNAALAKVGKTQK